MKYRYKRWVFPGMSSATFVFVLCLVFDQCAQERRIVTLERDRDYTLEVIRKRPVSEEFCTSLNGDGRICQRDTNRLCACRFIADQQDREHALLLKEIARRLDEEKAVAEQELLKLKAEREAAEEGDLSGTEEPISSEED